MTATSIVIPESLVDAVRRGRCVLFLGAMASAKSPADSAYTYRAGPPGGGQLSALLARLSKYKGSDRWNLLRVSQFYELQGDDRAFYRDRMAQVVRKVLTRQRVVPSPALHMLAALPFRLIVTTNYDHLFEQALGRAKTLAGRKKDPPPPIIYDRDPAKRKDGPWEIEEENPVLFKMHGDYSDTDSMVITEEDYIHFLEQMGDERTHPIPENIRFRVKNHPILFIGYGLKDWNLRVLLRALSWNIKPGSLQKSFSVDPFPDDLVAMVMRKSEKRQVDFLEHNLWDFVPALYQAVVGRPYP